MTPPLSGKLPLELGMRAPRGGRWPPGRPMTAYDVLFRRVLTRTDPERAHHVAFRAILAPPAFR